MGISSKTVMWKGSPFHIVRIAAGGSYYNGSFPVLLSYTRKCQRIIIGTRSARNYSRGKFLILLQNEDVLVEGQELFIGCDDPILRKKLHEGLEPEACRILFNKKFSHMTFSSRIEVGLWPVFSKKFVVEYTCLPEEVYKDEKVLNEYLEAFRIVKEKVERDVAETTSPN